MTAKFLFEQLQAEPLPAGWTVTMERPGHIWLKPPDWPDAAGVFVRYRDRGLFVVSPSARTPVGWFSGRGWPVRLVEAARVFTHRVAVEAR